MGWVTSQSLDPWRGSYCWQKLVKCTVNEMRYTDGELHKREELHSRKWATKTNDEIQGERNDAEMTLGPQRKR